MKTTEQCPGQSIYQHGLSVHERYRDIYTHVNNGTPLQSEWRLPEWIHDPALLWWTPDDLRTYHIFHDCGKPFCRELDGQGRQHFPDHAQISHDTFLRAGGDPWTARLILHDMDIHLLKSEQIPAFASNPEWSALLLTGLCEIHSNAAMFGGLNSTGFKIKFKHIDRRGRQILKHKGELS